MITTSNGETYKKPGFWASLGGGCAGIAVSSAVSAPSKVLSPILMNKMGDISNKLSDDEFALCEKGLNKILEDTGLAAKDVSILKATKNNKKEVKALMAEEFSSKLKILPKTIRDGLSRHYAGIYTEMLADGQNAVYVFKSKKVIMPEKKLILSGFHELGHASNANLSEGLKLLQKVRPLGLLATPIVLIGLFKNKKAPGQKPKNIVDKVTTFMKENAGKLIFAVMSPMLVEEGIATLKGNKFAQKVLSPELAQKVAKTNKLGFLTYLSLVGLASVGTYLGVKTRDAIAKPKLVEKK